MAVITRRFASRSSDAVYEAMYDPDTGDSSCNCPGWRNKRPNKPRECKHTKEMAGGAPEPPKEVPLSTEGVPDFVEPMLAHPKEREIPLSHYAEHGWTLEEKRNGQRIIICNGPTTLCCWSRPRAGDPPKPKSVPPHIHHAARQLPVGVFDGESFVPGGSGFWDSTRLDRRDDKAVVLWDVMNLQGTSTVMLPLTERRQLLASALAHIKDSPGVVTQAETLPVTQATLEEIWKAGGEGAMLKRPGGLYHPGRRSWDWLKVKKYLSAVLTIVGFDTGLTGPHAVMLLRDAEGGETRVKSQSSKMPPDFRAHPERYVGRQLCIEHQGRTPAGSFLHPMFDHLL